ncbi:MAG TPA: septum formation family protein, partial [Mycobacterium sp.]|nr:septum formation family protein [Mycobacterium sp.]
EPDQDGFIKDSCTKMTDAYLAPVKLRTTTLTLIYPTVPLASWTAGSRQVACSIGATLGNGGWATLLNGAKGQLLINGQPPVPPPDIPEDRLNVPPIPLQTPAQSPSTQSGSGSGAGSGTGSAPEVPPNNQHMPGQQPGQQAPQQQAPPPADNGAPPANPAPEAPAPPPPPPPPPPANPAPEAPPAEPPPGG